jgi:hypothetical protein
MEVASCGRSITSCALGLNFAENKDSLVPEPGNTAVKAHEVKMYDIASCESLFITVFPTALHLLT